MKKIVLYRVLALSIAVAAAVPGLLAQPKPKSSEEYEALKTMFGAQTPDARIAAAENVLTKFADTEFKSVALYFEAVAYDQKHDYEHTVVFGERTLEADPKYYQAMLLLAGVIAQRTKEFDLDREEKLAQVEKYSKNAIELVKDAPKPNPGITDDQWAAAKKDMASQAHTALGMGAMARKKYDVAESEFKIALDSADKPDPATMVRLGKVYCDDGKYDEAIAQFDKVMAMPDVNVTVKQVAQAERVRTIQKKNPPKPADAANPAPPAPPTPKP
ncbi:MAG TPA: tetratricopeptide repeat protein [Bryobacteraceae bacterium]|jgi:tetratricopeptide (TPR) repeat protein|nr:tetratricopeptide repeat protein [Bryobacteraceae bacterium]